MGQTTRGLGGGEAAAWMLENRLRGIADEEIKRQVCNPILSCFCSKSSLRPLHFLQLFGGAPLYRMQNQPQPFTQRAKKAPLDEDVTMEMEPNPFIQVSSSGFAQVDVRIEKTPFDLFETGPSSKRRSEVPAVEKDYRLRETFAEEEQARPTFLIFIFPLMPPDYRVVPV